MGEYQKVELFLPDPGRSDREKDNKVLPGRDNFAWLFFGTRSWLSAYGIRKSTIDAEYHKFLAIVRR